MPRVAKDDGMTKHQRLRARRQAQGMRLLRIWVPDPKVSGFAAEARRQAQLLRGTREEAGALDLATAVAADIEGWKP